MARGLIIATVSTAVHTFSTAVFAQQPSQGTATQAQGPAATDQALRTPWGEPDLQGIWTDELDTPLQRPAEYATQEFFTEAQLEELNNGRAALLARDNRAERGTERDVAGGYNSAFLSVKRIGARTSRIVDPPNGQMPLRTPQAQKAAAADAEFYLALLQSTDACKTEAPACNGGKYDPTPSPRRAELPPRYNTRRSNRFDNPEDGSLLDRCLAGGLPEFGTAFGGSFRRIVQTPGGITIFYDVGQGQGWQRNIVMDGSPHLPTNIRQWFGDSRGHWEGDTLVIDVTNFTPKTDYRGSRDNLHLVERWRRTGPTSLAYTVTIEDPTVWTRAWAVKQEFTKQSDEENRLFNEPRCFEGNYALPGMLRAQRLEELAFAQGRGPDPATKNLIGGDGFVLEGDPLSPFSTEQQ